MADSEIDAMLSVNLKGSIVFVREAVRQMLVERSTGASITVISSVVASRGSPGLSVYAATKAGLEGFAKSLAREVGPRGIRVNAIAPGLVKTDFAKALWEDDKLRTAREAATPLRRIGEPRDIGGIAVFLASQAAAFITGQCIVADGGVTII